MLESSMSGCVASFKVTCFTKTSLTGFQSEDFADTDKVSSYIIGLNVWQNYCTN